MSDIKLFLVIFLIVAIPMLTLIMLAILVSNGCKFKVVDEILSITKFSLLLGFLILALL